jgi:predicted TPR repeat methyltransferase
MGENEAKIRGNFDQSAASWTQQMDRMEYRGHLLVALLLERVVAGGVLERPILDLGCGTGFCGPLIKRFSTRLEGVDLSEKMLVEAAKTGFYDALHCSEIVAFLSAQRGYGALTAAGVVYYFSDLRPFFQAAHDALAPGGWLVFTTDSHPGPEDFVISPRIDFMFLHRLDYVRAVAAEHFDIVEMEICSERRDFYQLQPVPSFALAVRRKA